MTAFKFLKDAYPMSGGIKISPLLPLWKIYHINEIDTLFEKNVAAVLIILLSFQ